MASRHSTAIQTDFVNRKGAEYHSANRCCNQMTARYKGGNTRIWWNTKEPEEEPMRLRKDENSHEGTQCCDP